jgi:GT2 family glycosyltransferase
MSKPIIYAIVVTYNGAKWVDKCFGSLVNSSIPLKILAIDNASSDGTPKLIRKQFPVVEIIETGSNLGFGKANNIGLKRVLGENADYTFLLNQDAWVEPDTIAKLVEVQQKHPEFGILSPLPYDGEGKELDRQFKLYYSKPHTIGNICFNKENKVYEVPFINAAGWLTTYNTIKKVGLFYDLFFHRGEDVDYVNRCHFYNEKIGFHVGSKYYHDRKHVWHKETSKQKQFENIQNKLNVILNNINESALKRVKTFLSWIRSLYISKKITLSQLIFLIIKYIFKGPQIIYKSELLKSPYYKSKEKSKIKNE